MEVPTKTSILMICSQPFFEWRGSPIRVGFNLRALQESGFSVIFLGLPHGQERQIDGVRFIRCLRLPMVNKIPIGPSLPKLFYDIIHLVYGFGILLRNKNILVIHGIEDSGIPAVILAKLFGKKLVFEKHSDPASHKNSKWGVKNLILAAYIWVERLVIRQADLVIGTGDELVKQARRVKPALNSIAVPDIPSSLVESCEDTALKLREKLGLSREEVVAAYVGSFAVYQGLELLFAAIPLAVRQNPSLRFLIIGGTTEEIAEKKQTLSHQGIKDRVIFLGLVDPEDLPTYLKAADILLSPRISGKNSPLKLLDYLKAKRPIVATDIEANSQILKKSDALLIEPEPEAMAHAISCLVVDQQLRQTLAGRGQDLLQKRYNYPFFRKQIAKGYASLLPAKS